MAAAPAAAPDVVEAPLDIEGSELSAPDHVGHLAGQTWPALHRVVGDRVGVDEPALASLRTTSRAVVLPEAATPIVRSLSATPM